MLLHHGFALRPKQEAKAILRGTATESAPDLVPEPDDKDINDMLCPGGYKPGIFFKVHAYAKIIATTTETCQNVRDEIESRASGIASEWIDPSLGTNKYKQLRIPDDLRRTNESLETSKDSFFVATERAYADDLNQNLR
jgi:hypothetical protein